MRIDPWVLTQASAQQREEEQPARIGPRLGEHQQLEREPHQREVQPPVAHHDAGDADAREQDDGDHAAAARARGRVHRRRWPPGTALPARSAYTA